MIMRILYFVPTILLFTFICAPFTKAQFPDNPAENLQIVSHAGEMVQPKMVKTPDGGAYISWFGNPGGGYNVYLQRLDADGVLQWGADGIMVANRSFSSTMDYGLSIDVDGNALITFNDDRFGGDRITVNKVAPDGTLLWGTNGVQLTDGTGFVASPGVAGASDGGIVVTWFQDGITKVLSLNAEGETQWTHDLTASTNISNSHIAASDAEGETGEVIVMTVTLASFATPRILYAQKFDANGNTLWGEEQITIFTEGSLQLGNFPDFIPDGRGGMIVAWYKSVPTLQSFLQHIDDQGNALLPVGGLELSTNASRLRTNPSVAYDTEEQVYYSFWRETDSNQAQIGLWGQKVDADGNRLWTDNGHMLIPLGAQDIGNVETVILDGEPVVTFMTRLAPGNDIIRAARLNADAGYVWEGNFVDVSTVPSSKGRIAALKMNPNTAWFVWEDERNSTMDLYAQNLNEDGTLGEYDEPDPVPVRDVTFQVDMQVMMNRLVFLPESGDGVYTLGTFNGWDAGNSQAMESTGNGIYSITLEIEGHPGTEAEYKFFVLTGDGRDWQNDGWEGEVGPGENGNRVIALTENDLVLEPVFFNNEDGVNVPRENEIPSAFRLEQNYPNPFNPATRISFYLEDASNVRLEVFTLTGQLITELANGWMPTGNHSVMFNGDNLSSGIYLYRLTSDGFMQTRKMMLVK